MRSIGRTVRAYMELARLSNLPTCASNVLTGTAIGLAGGGTLEWGRLALVVAGVSLMYIAGMALNDVIDRSVDQQERPDRPIPSGRISPLAAFVFAGVALGAGLGILATQGLEAFRFGLGLAVAIVVYDLVHKRVPVTVLLMGACRGLVYLTAAASCAWPLDWGVAGPLAGLITIYVSLLTIIARVEARRSVGSRGWLAYSLPLVGLAPIGFIHPEELSWWVIVTGAMLLIWLLVAARQLWFDPPRIRQAVMAWLAGLCLIDALCLGLLERPLLVIIAIACFGVTTLGHHAVPGS